MDRVRKRVGDKRVRALVKAFLKAGILDEDPQLRDTDAGTPQGALCSAEHNPPYDQRRVYAQRWPVRPGDSQVGSRALRIIPEESDHAARRGAGPVCLEVGCDGGGRLILRLHPRHPRARRPVHHGNLGTRLDRSEAQSPRGRRPRHRHRRSARMEPRPRTARLARRPSNRSPGLCAALDCRPRSHQALQVSATHNPALLIRVDPLAAAEQRGPVGAGRVHRPRAGRPGHQPQRAAHSASPRSAQLPPGAVRRRLVPARLGHQGRRRSPPRGDRRGLVHDGFAPVAGEDPDHPHRRGPRLPRMAHPAPPQARHQPTLRLHLPRGQGAQGRDRAR